MRWDDDGAKNMIHCGNELSKEFEMKILIHSAHTYIFYFVIFSFCLVFFAIFFTISHRKIVSTLFQLVVVNACTSLKFYYFCWSFSLLSFLRVERNFLPANFVTTTTKADSSVIYLCLYMPLTMEIYIWMRKCEQENQRKRENLCVECCALMRTSLDSCIYSSCCKAERAGRRSLLLITNWKFVDVGSREVLRRL